MSFGLCLDVVCATKTGAESYSLIPNYGGIDLSNLPPAPTLPVTPDFFPNGDMSEIIPVASNDTTTPVALRVERSKQVADEWDWEDKAEDFEEEEEQESKPSIVKPKGQWIKTILSYVLCRF